MMTGYRLQGLIAAAYTPLNDDGTLRLAQVGPLVEHVLAGGANGFYVCGSTGEGMSLTVEERKTLSREFVRCVDGRVPVVVQVGHNSLADAAALAADAQAAGADAISATCPSYYPIRSLEILVESMAQVASAAPEVPFYYYHIPTLTGVDLPMGEFLLRAADRVDSFVGLKYTKSSIDEYQHCCELEGGRFDVIWGIDEMLLSALVLGAAAAIGSTYNIAAPLYRRICEQFSLGCLDAARQLQLRAVQIISTIGQFPFHPGMKEILRWQGVDCGGPRLPLRPLTADEASQLRRDLTRIHFTELSGCAFVENSDPPGKYDLKRLERTQ